MDFLRANKEVFAWERKQLVGVPRGVTEHHLKVCPNVRPVKQRARRQSTEKQSFIVQETRKLQAAGVIREVRYPVAGEPHRCAQERWEGMYVCGRRQPQ